MAKRINPTATDATPEARRLAALLADARRDLQRVRGRLRAIAGKLGDDGKSLADEIDNGGVLDLLSAVDGALGDVDGDEAHAETLAQLGEPAAA